jgi:hypothetical protein
MERAVVLTVWIAGLAAGIATWWALLAWLGPGVLFVPLALAGAVAVGGPARDAAPPELPSSPLGLD